MPVATEQFMSELNIDAEWNKEPLTFRAAVKPESLLTIGEITELTKISALKWPSFTVIKDGRRTPPAELTETRTIIGSQSAGFLSPAKVGSALGEGATLRLNQAEEWHPAARRIAQILQDKWLVEVKTYIFFTPGGETGMLPHRDASHVLAVQLAGGKEWRLYDPGDRAKADAGLDVDPDAFVQRVVMQPGDVLYLPHAWPHAATAVGGDSLHITFTLTEPPCEELAKSLLQSWSDQAAPLLRSHHHLTTAAKVQAVRNSLLETAQAADTGELVADALLSMRSRLTP
jgi:ribosomal protein L16 Arg81 hydroxylase